MKSSNPCIWINVTTSQSWLRPPVGIVRVEQCIAKELAKLYGSSRFKYCIWQQDHFVEWMPQDYSKKSHDKALPQKNSQTKFEPIFPILSRQNALIALAQGILSLMPSKLQVYFNRLLYSLRPVVLRLLRGYYFETVTAKLRAYKIFKQKQSEKMLIEKNTLFSAGDVLISFGTDWNEGFHSQYFFLRKYKGVKVVTCCYDLIPVLYPQYCLDYIASKFASYFFEIADGSDLILCISKQSETDLNALLERTGAAQPATHVFYLGDNVIPEGNQDISTAVTALIQEPFILFVSTIERRKNHEVLYKAYHQLCAAGKRADLPKLVFVGMPGWGVDDLLNDIEIDPLTLDLIVLLNHVSDTELKVLYDAACFCVYPSLYEGWGLPVGEALSLGKVVISSNRGSLPEIAGDLVLYVDPWDSKTWAEEIYRMATDNAWREQWTQKVKLGYQSRTWSDAALTVKSQIDKLINS